MLILHSLILNILAYSVLIFFSLSCGLIDVTPVSFYYRLMQGLHSSSWLQSHSLQSRVIPEDKWVWKWILSWVSFSLEKLEPDSVSSSLMGRQCRGCSKARFRFLSQALLLNVCCLSILVSDIIGQQYGNIITNTSMNTSFPVKLWTTWPVLAVRLFLLSA